MLTPRPSRSILTEARAMTALALPVVADQIGLMSMSFVDTIMVGRLGSEALGAVAVGTSVYFFYMVFAYGVISAVGPTVAQAFGAGNREEISRSVAQAFWIGIVLAAGALVLVWNIGPILELLEQPKSLIPIAERYTRALGYGVLGSLWYAVLRAFAVGLGRTRVPMVISLVASALNALLNYILIYGHLGFPALGVEGSGYATTLAQWGMFAMMLYYVLRDRDLRLYRFPRHILPLDFPRLLRLIKLGAPIGGGNSMEVGIFALTSLLMGRIGTVPLASHQIALNVASITFMIPMGISTAVTTRVGQAVGRRDPGAATLAGWVGVGLSVAVMCLTALAFLTIPGAIISIYTDDTAILGFAGGLLMIAGAFQIFDGLQVAALGALRGLKDTARPMLVNLFSYWLVGMPTGYLLGFTAGFGGPGLWWGLTAGLAAAAVLHSLRFRKLTRRLGDEESDAVAQE